MLRWKESKKILCVRADNLGDVIMTGPAIRALKEKFQSEITLLTSSAGKAAQGLVPHIDDYIIFDAPWVRNTNLAASAPTTALIELLKERNFDAAIIFTVYSQSALPAAFVCLLADIPLRLAYSRENPYALLTDWIPDEEPYHGYRHQVQRDLDLVRFIGADTDNDHLQVIPAEEQTNTILSGIPFPFSAGFIILHPGVSEEKRKYPVAKWIEAGKALMKEFDLPVVVTGTDDEAALAETIAEGIGAGCLSLAGMFPIQVFATLLGRAHLVVTVNTATVHICAALQTPQVVLYAMTNPQHTPWKSPHEVLFFPVGQNERSKSPVIQWVQDHWKGDFGLPTARDIVNAAMRLGIRNKRPAGSGTRGPSL